MSKARKKFDKKTAKQLRNPTPIWVSIEAINCDVRIRPLSGLERIEYIKKQVDIHEDDTIELIKIMAELVALSVIDEDGDRVYEEGDFESVLCMNLKGVRQIAEQVNVLNGFDLEEAEGNS